MSAPSEAKPKIKLILSKLLKYIMQFNNKNDLKKRKITVHLQLFDLWASKVISHRQRFEGS